MQRDYMMPVAYEQHIALLGAVFTASSMVVMAFRGRGSDGQEMPESERLAVINEAKATLLSAFDRYVGAIKTKST